MSLSDESSDRPVPFIDLPAQFKGLQAEIDQALAAIFLETSFIQGPAVKVFETAFAGFIGAEFCIAVHSGTAALHLALLALGIGPGDEVITAPNSFIATAEAISFTGARPVFVDVDPLIYTLDPEKIEAAITSRTKAIIPVHLYGQAADMQPIEAVAQKFGLKIVEDACQAHGATYQGRRVGALGNLGCFSFYPGKNLGAAGDAGAVVTNDAELAQKILLLRDHGSVVKYHHQIIGHNFRLDSIQAAILSIKLKHLEGWNARRCLLAQRYDDRLAKLAGIGLPVVRPDRRSVYHLYVITTANRHLVKQSFKKAQIQWGIHYPIPIHLQPAYENLGYKPGQFPVSEALSQQVVSLPIFPELSELQQDRVIAALKEASLCMGKRHFVPGGTS